MGVKLQGLKHEKPTEKTVPQQGKVTRFAGSALRKDRISGLLTFLLFCHDGLWATSRLRKRRGRLNPAISPQLPYGCGDMPVVIGSASRRNGGFDNFPFFQ
jgi:hypothetical protein